MYHLSAMVSRLHELKLAHNDIRNDIIVRDDDGNLTIKLVYTIGPGPVPKGTTSNQRQDILDLGYTLEFIRCHLDLGNISEHLYKALEWIERICTRPNPEERPSASELHEFFGKLSSNRNGRIVPLPLGRTNRQ